MTRKIYCAHLIGCLLPILFALPVAGEPPASSFLYQGFLTQSGLTPDGFYGFRFTVYNALIGGDVVDSTITFDGVAVDLGLFSVELDFGNGLFTNEALWVEVEVREGANSGVYTTLSPRQPLRLFSLNGKEAPLKEALSGLVTVGLGSSDVTGVGTLFTQELAVGGALLINDEIHTVAQIDNDTRLFLEMSHGTGALSEEAFKDGTLLRVQAGDHKDIVVVDGQGVTIGNDGTPTSRIDHGTIGDCGSGSLSSSGSVNFLEPFIQTPRIYLSAVNAENGCFTAVATSVSATGFSWESWGPHFLNGLYLSRRSCRCINWEAKGI